MSGGFLNFGVTGGSGGSGHSHPNLNVLNGIALDNYGQLYYNTGYSLSDLKTQSILCLLGSTADSSGYGNNAINSGPNYPTQVAGLDNQTVLNFANSNSQLRCSNLQANLVGSSGATIYTVFQPISSGYCICEHTATNQFDGWWQWNGDGQGYMAIFRNSRLIQAPSGTGWQCWSIHSRSADYEVLINKVSKGVQGVNGVSGTYWQGNDFLISPNWRPFLGSLALLIVIPFWVDKASVFHAAKMAAIKGRFPSLPFTV